MSNLPNKDNHYSISKAAQELQITPQLLRQWETRAEFIPNRNDRGHRYYTGEDIQFLKDFKNKINKRSYVTKNQEILEIKKRIEYKLHRDFEVTRRVNLFKKVLKFSTLGLIVASFALFVIMGMTSATFAQKYINKTALLGMFGLGGSGGAMDSKIANVLGERDQEADFLFSINVPTNIGADLTVEGNAIFEGDISTPGVNLLGTGTLAGVATIDAATQATLQGTLAVGGDLEGTLATALVSDGVLDGTEFADFVTLDGDLDVTGEFQADGDAGSDGQVLTSTGSGAEWLDLDSVDAETLDGVDSTGFLRSDTSDDYTSGTLAFSDSTFLDLSLITHNDVAVQGFKLPQADSLTAPTTGEGFLAYDTDDDKILIYNGTSWSDVSGASTTLQEAYVAGNSVQLSATNGDLRISNDSSAEMFFADESTGRIGIGNISPLFKLDVTGTLGVSGAVTLASNLSAAGTIDFDGLTSSTSENSIIVQNPSGELLVREFSDFVEDDLIAVGEGAANFLPKWTGSRTLTDSSIYDNGTNVGIGTSSPSYKLHVIGRAEFEGDVLMDDQLYMTTSTLETLYHSQNQLFINRLESANDVVINGLVGIGNTNPSYKLDVNGDVQIASGSELYSYGSATLGNRTYTDDRYVTDDQTFTASIDALDQQIYGIVAGESGIWLDRGTYIEPSTSTGNFAISDAGNVGIGTTSPQGPLGFNTTLEKKIIFYPYLGYDAGIRTTSGLIVDNFIPQNAEAFTWSTVNISNGSYSEKMRIATNGNIGIGTTSPSSLLSVGATNQFTIDSSGDITKINNVAYSFPSSQAGASDYVLSNDGSGNLSWTSVTGDGGLGALDGTGTANYLPLWSDANTLTSSSLYETGGQIGVGTTSPGATLEIAGDLLLPNTTSADKIRFGIDTAQYKGQEIYVDNADAVGSSLVFANKATNGPFKFISAADSSLPVELQFAYYGGHALLSLDTSTPTKGSIMQWGANGTPRWTFAMEGNSYGADFNIYPENVVSNFSINTDDLFIDSGLGYVGIGTTAPASLLDVAGTFGVSGAVDLDGLPSDSSEDSIVVQLADGTLSYREFSDFTADDGITDGVGTANYIPIWNDANTIGLSSIYETGGNVGIGTTSPLANLHSTVGAGGTDDIGILIFGSTNNTTFTDERGNLQNAGTLVVGTNWGDANGSLGTLLNLYNANGSKFLVRADGNVGIGTTSPAGRLHIMGSADDQQLVVQANGTQTANLLELQNSSGNVLSGIQGRGTFYSDLNTASNNLFVGLNSGNTSASGDYNIATGTLTLSALTTGTRNTALGYNALNDLTESTYNTAIGSNALDSIVASGHYNTAIGSNAGSTLTTGDSNVVIGVNALAVNQTGINNTSIGNNAGNSNTGSSNVFVGFGAGHSETGSNKLYLASGDNTALIYGDFSTGTVGIGGTAAHTNPFVYVGTDGSVGIGTTNPNNTLQVVDLINFDNTNTSTFLGYQTGDVNTGTNNTFTGYQAGDVNTTGSFNNFFGQNAGGKNTSGGYNIFVGAGSGSYNLTGGNNVYVGSYAGQYSTGGSNTFVGSTAGEGNTGQRNTFLGMYAGRLNTGSDNVFLGRYAGKSETGSNKLYLANGENTSLIYGDFSTGTVGIGGTAAHTNPFVYVGTDGSVGIGTTTPSQELEVAGDILLTGTIALNGASIDPTNGINIAMSADSVAVYGTATTLDMSAATTITGHYVTDGSITAGAGVFGFGAVLSNTTAEKTAYDAVIYNGDGTAYAASASTGGTGYGISAGATDAYGFVSLVGTTNDGVTDNAYSYLSKLVTYAGASDVGYGLQVVDNLGLSSGGTQYGVYVDLDDTDVTNWALYTVDAGGDSYLGDDLFVGGNVGIGTTAPIGEFTLNTGTDENLTITKGTNYASPDGITLLSTNDANSAYKSITVASSNFIINAAGGTGNVGIGTTSPNAILEISGANQAQLLIGESTGTNGDTAELLFKVSTGDINYAKAGLIFEKTGSNGIGDLFLANRTSADSTTVTKSDAKLTILSDGNIGIGTTAPAYALDVLASGTGVIARFNSANSSGCTLATGGTISCTSDEKLKTNISTLESSVLGKVLGLNPVTFDWKSGETGEENLGFIAQDVELIIPQLVSVDVATGYKQLNTIGIIPLLTKAIQEQQTQIEALQALIGGDATESTEATSSASLATLEGTELYESMLTIFNEFKDFVEALGLSKQVDEDGNEILAVSSDMNVTGTTTLADVKITGNLTAGLIEIDTLNNEVNVLGASCYNSATNTHNTELCDSQTLYIQKALAGNLDILGGIVVIEPNGKMTLKGTLEVEQLSITTTDNPSAGKATIEAGETSLTINTDKVTDSTLILATPRTPVIIGTNFVGEGIFEIEISTALETDLQVDWLLVGTE